MRHPPAVLDRSRAPTGLAGHGSDSHLRRGLVNHSRRRFIQTAAAGGAVAALSSRISIAAAGSNLTPIIDTHQHLWDLDKFTLPWIEGENAPAVLKRSYVTKDFLEATKGLNVVKAIYMEVDVRPDLQVKEAEHVIALSKSADHPTVAAVISGRPASPRFRDFIMRYMDTPEIKGVRQVLQGRGTPKGFCLGEGFVRSVQLLGELGKSFDICIRPSELGAGAKLAEKCPDTLCILDHCGNADPKAWLPERRRQGGRPWHQVDQWQRDIEALARRKNVICKISGLIARAPKADWRADDLAPAINFCLDAFGPDRVIYGGDWPVCKVRASYRAWVSALEEILASRSGEDRKKLLHDNAVKFYGLAQL